MLRLFKYLKPYVALILVSVVLLFVQANADLALPDYMSKIINNGIQQGGVEDAVPQAMRKSTLDKLALFMSDDDLALVQNATTLVDKSSPDYQRTLELYPALAQEPIYVLNPVDAATRKQLNLILSKSFVVVSGIQQALADPAKAAALGQKMGFDLSKLPPGTDIFAMLGKLPAAQRAKISEAINQQFATLGDNMITQMAVVAVKAEYDALGMDTSQLQNNYILRTGALMLLLTLVSITASIAVGFLAARTAAGVARDLRRDVFDKVVNFSAAEFNKFSTASLITRSTNDITQLQTVLVMVMRIVFYAPILGVGGIIHAIETGPSMWWIIVLGVVVLVGIIMSVFAISLPKFKIMQSLIDRLNLILRENLTGMMVVRAFNKQAYEEQRFDGANRELTDTSLFVNRVMVFLMPALMLIMSGLSLLIIWVGAHEVAKSTMQVGDMMAFLQYAMQIVMAFLMMSFMFIFLPRSFVSGDRIAEVLETELTVTDPPQPKTFPEPFRGIIEFRDVGFHYPGAEENVLCDINFVARPGQTTAFVGSTGSGKSTVVNLIPRFYDVTEGAILIDGVDLRQVTQRYLRTRIGYIPQRGVLFSGTVESNLRYANEDAPPELMAEAIEIAQASEFVFANPEGLKAEIAQGGGNVSGGQKQRLAIARALVKQAPIYIFDDSFSALDYKTDAALRRALKEKAADSTVLLVTQRVATAKHAEQIIVLEEGRIVGKGTHKELLETNETYREIALSQLRQEELS
ncbi:MAG: ABC transporter ATP-binding protein [Chloroflexi bacterium]|nr:ABC transporter ATP-binding protein [Chloroflexota bacterium]